MSFAMWYWSLEGWFLTFQRKSQVVKEGPRRFFLNCLTLKMKVLCSFTTSVTTHPATHHILEVKNPEHSISPYMANRSNIFTTKGMRKVHKAPMDN
jgi:hypothetical protein